MSKPNDLKTRLHKRLGQMSVIRDEVRVQVHLASMEAKARWDVVEAELFGLEKAAEQAVTEANHVALTAGMTKVKAFRAWLDEKR
ncbi:MAG: hypothetical protein WKG00_27435 [Polyangiaceae bacterium]